MFSPCRCLRLFASCCAPSTFTLVWIIDLVTVPLSACIASSCVSWILGCLLFLILAACSCGSTSFRFAVFSCWQTLVTFSVSFCSLRSCARFCFLRCWFSSVVSVSSASVVGSVCFCVSFLWFYLAAVARDDLAVVYGVLYFFYCCLSTQLTFNTWPIDCLSIRLRVSNCR